jgi:hypothetical protein
MMDFDARPVRNDGFHSEILDQEMILYFPGGSRFLYLNQTAALLWESSDGSRSVNEIITALQAIFPDSAVEIRADVENTIGSFLQHGCITLL